MKDIDIEIGLSRLKEKLKIAIRDYPMIKDELEEAFFEGENFLDNGAEADISFLIIERNILDAILALYMDAEQNNPFKVEDPKGMKRIFNYLSPDNITIRNEGFDTPKQAYEYLQEWVSILAAKQGYYSSNNGRINIDDVIVKCQFCVMYYNN